MAHSNELREFVLTDRGFNLLDAVSAARKALGHARPFGGKGAIVMQMSERVIWAGSTSSSVRTL